MKEHQEPSFWKTLPHQGDRAIRRPVIHEDYGKVLELLSENRAQARLQVAPAVPVEDDERDPLPTARTGL
jgi:hypothetical protein